MELDSMCGSVWQSSCVVLLTMTYNYWNAEVAIMHFICGWADSNMRKTQQEQFPGCRIHQCLKDNGASVLNWMGEGGHNQWVFSICSVAPFWREYMENYSHKVSENLPLSTNSRPHSCWQCLLQKCAINQHFLTFCSPMKQDLHKMALPT
jgi:hypothetical protein